MYDSIANVINKKQSQRLRFDHTDEQYKHVLETFRENKTLWDLDIHRDRLKQDRKPDPGLINKKKILLNEERRSDGVLNFSKSP